MALKVLKPITVTILGQKHVRKDWLFDFDDEAFASFFELLTKDMRKKGFLLKKIHNKSTIIKIKSYSDLLNVVKISSPDGGHSNQCIGHIIGKSENLDIKEDIQAAINRIAFAPETIAPANEFRKVCHNCGCGC